MPKVSSANVLNVKSVTEMANDSLNQLPTTAEAFALLSGELLFHVGSSRCQKRQSLLS